MEGPDRTWKAQARRGDSGAALVEFAIGLVILAVVVFGTLDIGRAYFTWSQVKNAAREGAVYAERDPWSQSPSGSSCANPRNITYRAQNEGGTTRPEFSVSTTRNGVIYSGCKTPGGFAISPGDRIAVQVNTPFNPISPLGVALFGHPTISARVEVVVQ